MMKESLALNLDSACRFRALFLGLNLIANNQPREDPSDWRTEEREDIPSC